MRRMVRIDPRLSPWPLLAPVYPPTAHTGNRAAGGLDAVAASATLMGPGRHDRRQRRSAMEYVGGTIIVIIIAFLIYRAIREGKTDDRE